MQGFRSLIRQSVRLSQSRWSSTKAKSTTGCVITSKATKRETGRKMEVSSGNEATSGDRKPSDSWYYVPRCRPRSEMQIKPPYDQLERHVLDIVEHGIGSASASRLIKENMRVSDGMLHVRDRRYNLHQNVHVIAVGKAALGMARAVDDLLQEHVVRGVAIVPAGLLERARGVEQMLAEQGDKATKANGKFLLRAGSRIRVMEGAKDNLPDEAALQAAKEAKKLAESLKQDDILVVLVTGGGSALLPLPVPEITLEEKKTVGRLLGISGANIYDLNAVRKQLSQLKGGKLAELAFPAKVVSFVLSDVVGDAVEYIASGPTMIDTSSSASHALDIIKQYDLLQRLPSRVIEYLQRKAAEEASAAEASGMKAHSPAIAALLEGRRSNNDELSTSALGGAGAGEDSRAASAASNMMNESRKDRLEMMQFNVQNVIIGNNRLALQGAANYAQNELGYESYVLSSQIGGSVENAAQLFYKLCVFLDTWYDYYCNLRSVQHGRNCASELERVEVGGIVNISEFVNKLVHQASLANGNDSLASESARSSRSDSSEQQAQALSQAEIDLVRCGVKKEQLNDVLGVAYRAFQLGRPMCILAGGELTVRIKADAANVGQGGRCMHLGTVMAKRLQDLQQSLTVNSQLSKTRLAFQFCAVGTDGQDGPTPGAGAYVNPLTLTCTAKNAEEAANARHACEEAIQNFDSYTWLHNHADGRFLLRYAYTDSNVMDLYALLVTRYEV